MAKKKIRQFSGIMALMLIATVGFEGYRFYQNTQPKGIAVLGVLDGDTITVEGKTRFRLRNIDAPELKYCGGKEAKQKLDGLIRNKRIRIEEETLDYWGRPMGLVYVDNKLINLEMIKSGLAKFHSDKTTRSVEMKKVDDNNQNTKKGIYGQCWQTENTDNPKCNIKGNIDPANSEIKVYHLAGCVQYKTTIVELDRGEEWFCSELEAKKAGYVKSNRCP